MAFYTDESGRVVDGGSRVKEKQKVRTSTNLDIAKVFGYMFVGLLITGLVAFGLAYLFYRWMLVDSVAASDTLFVLMIVSVISMFVLTIVISISFNRNKIRRILIPAILYTVVMGVMISTLVLFLDWRLLGGAFVATSLIFGVMALIALISKGSLNGLYIVGIGLMLGAGLMSMFTWFLYLISPSTFETFYWIITLGMFAAMMFITMWDIWRIKQIAEKGALTTSVSLYCAFNLYVDFIYIFLRMVYFISRFNSRK